MWPHRCTLWGSLVLSGAVPALQHESTFPCLCFVSHCQGYWVPTFFLQPHTLSATYALSSWQSIAICVVCKFLFVPIPSGAWCWLSKELSNCEVTFHSVMKTMLSVSKSQNPGLRMVELGPLHTLKNTGILTRMYFSGSDPAYWAESVMLGSVGEEMYLWTCYLGLQEQIISVLRFVDISRVLSHMVVLSLWWHLWKDSRIYGEGLEEMILDLSYLVCWHCSH